MRRSAVVSSPWRRARRAALSTSSGSTSPPLSSRQATSRTPSSRRRAPTASMRVGQLTTQPAGAQRRQLAEEDLGEERVGERHRRPPARGADLQQAAVLEVFEDAVADDAGEGVEGDLAGHGEQLGGVVVGLVEAPEALGDQVLERRGRLDRPDEVPDAVVHGQGAGVPGGLDELAEDPGVAHGQVAGAGRGTRRPAVRRAPGGGSSRCSPPTAARS